jgi:RNA polymerase sigma-70 factor (ECF subfamily)
MSEETCWTLIRDAADGDGDARTAFARAYLPVVRAYLGARWARGPFRDEVDDAVQDAFVECLRGDGALAKADPEKPGRFRTFLYAVVRNVALRHEERAARERARREGGGVAAEDLSAEDPRLSQVFDRAWADALLKRAAAGQRAAARERGENALRRVELLRLRFAEGLPIREIAARWEEDPAVVHRQYARAREEYKEALRSEVAFHHAGTPGEIERECRALLELLE